jgi:hypothetical protein
MSGTKKVDSLSSGIIPQASLVPQPPPPQKALRFNHDVISFKEDGLQEIRIKLL